MSAARSWIAVIAGSAMAVTGASHAQDASTAAWIGARPAIQLELEPGSDTGTYVVAATVTDLRNGATLATPRLEFSAAAPAVIELGVPGEVTLRLEISVDLTGTRANWSFELRDGDERLTEQRATLTLSRPREASY